jgi:hypothetical protein
MAKGGTGNNRKAKTTDIEFPSRFWIAFWDAGQILKISSFNPESNFCPIKYPIKEASPKLRHMPGNPHIPKKYPARIPAKVLGMSEKEMGIARITNNNSHWNTERESRKSLSSKAQKARAEPTTKGRAANNRSHRDSG